MQTEGRNLGSGMEIFLAVLGNATRCAVTDFFQQIHVGVETDAKSENGNLLKSICSVNGLNNFLLNILIASARAAVCDEDNCCQSIFW